MTENKTYITPVQMAISANLDVLANQLTQAAKLAIEAKEAMDKGEQNLAIGTILSFERTLPDTLALFNAALILHRASA